MKADFQALPHPAMFQKSIQMRHAKDTYKHWSQGWSSYWIEELLRSSMVKDSLVLVVVTPLGHVLA